MARGDGLAAVHRHLHHQRIAQRARDLGEERARQIGLVAVAQEGVAMERVDAIEQRASRSLPSRVSKRDAGFGDAAPLAVGFLALLGGEGLEEGVEALVAAIGPVELAVAPQQPARALAGRAAGLIEEEGVRGGEAVARRRWSRWLRSAASPRSRRIEVRCGQQARAGGRRERHGDRELRVVVAAERACRPAPSRNRTRTRRRNGTSRTRARRRRGLRIASA